MVYLNILFSIRKIAQYNLYEVVARVKNHQISSEGLITDGVEIFRY